MKTRVLKLLPIPMMNFYVDVHIDYNSKVLGHQYASMKNISRV